MLIISKNGELKALPADISVIGGPGTLRGVIGAKVTSSVALSRTAGQRTYINWDTAAFNTGSMWDVGTAARIYVRQDGWYLLHAYLTSITAVAHTSVMSITSSRLNDHIAYRTRKFQAGSASYPNAIVISAKAYALRGDSFYVNWGTTQAVSTLTGEMNVGFGVWKTS